MKKKRVILALASLFVLASCGQVNSSDQTGDGGTSLDDSNDKTSLDSKSTSEKSSSFEEVKNVDLSKFKLPNIEDYASIGYGNIKTNDKYTKRSRKDEKTTADNKAYSSKDLDPNYELESDTPFTLIGQMKDQSVETLSFEGEDERMNVTISAFQNLGDFIAFRILNRNHTYENYSLEKCVRLFSDDEYGKDASLTYLLSKKTGKIYYVGNRNINGNETEALWMWWGWPTTNGKNIFVNGNTMEGDATKTLIISEVNDSLNIKAVGYMNIQNCDCYGNIATDLGFVSSDLKNHKLSSFFNGDDFKYVYAKGINKFFAEYNDTLYLLNENCEFVEAQEKIRVFPTTSYEPEGNAIFYYSSLNIGFSYDSKLVDESGNSIISLDEIYEASEEKQSDTTHISLSKPWTWGTFALYWMSIINGVRNALSKGEEIPDKFSNIDVNYIEKWGYVYEKFLKSKCQDATKEEATEAIHQYFYGLMADYSGYSSERNEMFLEQCKHYYDGRFDENGNYEIDSNHPFDELWNLSYGDRIYEFGDITACLCGSGLVLMKQRSDGYSFESIGHDFDISRIVFRGSNCYWIDDKKQMRKVNMDGSNHYEYEILDTGDYSVSNMYVEDGNIVVTGIDENLDQFTGYLDENDQISFEKVDFGGESSYTLYPIN